MSVENIPHFIHGEFLPPSGKQYLDNFNPATGHVYSKVADGNETDLNQAVTSAQSVFSQWAATPTETRANLLSRIGDLILESLDELAMAESVDTGKPYSLARTVDIPRAAKNFHFFAAAISQFSSDVHETTNDVLNFTLRQPMGVVACISPWNLPLYLLTWKIAPALAAGNTVIAKPSEVTPMSAHLLAKLSLKAGLPKGVLNIVHGNGRTIGPLISKHPGIRAISFTGGTKTGADIATLAAPSFKRLTLEMGGKNPTLVFKNCNYEKMLKTVVRSAFSNQGQICLCGSRILIEKSLYSRFKEDFVSLVKKLKVDDPVNQDTDQGALVSEAHMNRVLESIALAQKEGGSILTGGKRKILQGRCKDGWFVEPTVIEGLPANCATNQEEIFGPVVTLLPFEKEEEAISLSNSVRYGLASSVWTQDLSQAHRVSRKLESGIVWINTWMQRDLRTPFGGMKQSGLGREGGFEALKFFTEPKTVCMDIGETL